MSQSTVLVIGTSDRVSLKSALRAIAKKRAKWVRQNHVIRFLHDPISATASAPGEGYCAAADAIAEQYQTIHVPFTAGRERLYHIGMRGAWAWETSVYKKPHQNRDNGNAAGPCL